MGPLTSGMRRVLKRRRLRVTNAIKDMEYDDDPQMAELLRLAQEDMFNFKRSLGPTMEERGSLLEKALSTELPLLERARIQAAKGDPSKVRESNYYDKELLKRFNRRMGTHGQDISAELAKMESLEGLQEDDEARRRRRASQFSLSEYDEENGFSDEPIEIPGDTEDLPTRMSPATFEEAMQLETDLLHERIKARVSHVEGIWSAFWTPQTESLRRHARPPFTSRMLQRYPSLRKWWKDDERAWRRPAEWHENYNPSTNLRLTDGVSMNRGLVASAAKTSLQLWEGCPSMEDVGQPIVAVTVSENTSSPAISPSIWTYPGNLVCFMDRRGHLDIFSRHAFDRDAWWITRYNLPEAFLKRIPSGYDLSASPLGENHIALFSYQSNYNPNVQVAPLGAAWIVPKAELSTGANIVSLPPVPLPYFKPFSAKEHLFAIGYNHHSDSHYKILALVWDTPDSASWQETEMKNKVPLYWSSEILIGDYPESLYREGTASVCTAEDQSKIFITAPSSTGQYLLVIDTETWDFVEEASTVPPAWGAAVVHDHLNDRLVLAGGIGHSNPEPLVRAVNLSTFDWQILRREGETPRLGAYGGAFPIGPGSFAVIGGFWRSGIKKMHMQPASTITVLHTTDCFDYRIDTMIEKLAPFYYPDGVPEVNEKGEIIEEGEELEEGEEVEFIEEEEAAVNTNKPKEDPTVTV